MVDVTHDGDDRRAGLQVVVDALVVTEGEIEGAEQLAVLVLGTDDLNLVVQLGAEQLQRLLVHRLRRGDHLAEVEEHLDEGGRVGIDLVREVGEGRAARKAQHGTVAARDLDAAAGRGRHVVELGPALLLALAATRGRTATAAERTGRAGAAATTATGTAATAEWGATGSTAGSTRTAAGAAAETAAATAGTCTGTTRTAGITGPGWSASAGRSSAR